MVDRAAAQTQDNADAVAPEDADSVVDSTPPAPVKPPKKTK